MSFADELRGMSGEKPSLDVSYQVRAFLGQCKQAAKNRETSQEAYVCIEIWDRPEPALFCEKKTKKDFNGQIPGDMDKCFGLREALETELKREEYGFKSVDVAVVERKEFKTLLGPSYYSIKMKAKW